MQALGIEQRERCLNLSHEPTVERHRVPGGTAGLGVRLDEHVIEVVLFNQVVLDKVEELVVFYPHQGLAELIEGGPDVGRLHGRGLWSGKRLVCSPAERCAASV